MKQENIENLPNAITAIRVILTVFIIYAVFAHIRLIVIGAAFIAAMITDFVDGQTARRFNQVTEFGRKFDMIADRILLIGTILAFIIDFYMNKNLSSLQLTEIMFMLSREMISFPFAIYAYIKKRPIPHARFSGKITTFFQGVTFPLIIFSRSHPVIMSLSLLFSLITFGSGLLAGSYYINDISK